MAPGFASLSASKLQELRKGPTIIICWRRDYNSLSQVVYDSFPKNVATTFSAKIKAHFSPTRQAALPSFTMPQNNSFTIIGGNLCAAQEILKWMLSCCHGSGLKVFPYPHGPAFWKLVKGIEAAEYLEIDGLSEKLHTSVGTIASRLVQLSDVKKICKEYRPGNEFYDMVIASVGNSLRSNRIHAHNPLYVELRDKLPPFAQVIDAFLEAAAGDEVLTVPRQARMKEQLAKAVEQKAERKAAAEKRKQARQAAQRTKWAEQLKEAHDAQRLRSHAHRASCTTQRVEGPPPASIEPVTPKHQRFNHTTRYHCTRSSCLKPISWKVPACELPANKPVEKAGSKKGKLGENGNDTKTKVDAAVRECTSILQVMKSDGSVEASPKFSQATGEWVNDSFMQQEVNNASKANEAIELAKGVEVEDNEGETKEAGE